MTVSLIASQALRRWKRWEEGRFWHSNNSVPTGDALWMTDILERVPETPRARGLSWALACALVAIVGLKSLLVDGTVMEAGREGETDS